jgi:hypothetical protein
MIRFYLDIYIWKIRKFEFGFYHSLQGAIDLCLGFFTIVIYYKPEEERIE